MKTIKICTNQPNERKYTIQSHGSYGFDTPDIPKVVLPQKKVDNFLREWCHVLCFKRSHIPKSRLQLHRPGNSRFKLVSWCHLETEQTNSTRNTARVPQQCASWTKTVWIPNACEHKLGNSVSCINGKMKPWIALTCDFLSVCFEIL